MSVRVDVIFCDLDLARVFCKCETARKLEVLSAACGTTEETKQTMLCSSYLQGNLVCAETTRLTTWKCHHSLRVVRKHLREDERPGDPRQSTDEPA